MGGGLMQLVAYGAQDIYLTGNPQITFFKVVYRRHTNFSMEAIEQTISGDSAVAATSRTGTVTISRNGDLVHKVYVTSSTAGVTDGDSIVNEVELEIGGQRIDRHYKEWNQIWNELSTPESKAIGLKSMKGCVGSSGTTGADMVQVPLNFWFCRNPGLALPLIALQYHEVKLKITWGITGDVGIAADCKVMCDYIYLDTDERRRFAQVSHEYLIEQLQKQSADTSGSVKLNFNHPVKELIWTSAATNAYGTAQLKLNGHDRFSSQEEEYFQLRQPYDYHTAVPRQNLPSAGQSTFLDRAASLTALTNGTADGVYVRHATDGGNADGDFTYDFSENAIVLRGAGAMAASAAALTVGTELVLVAGDADTVANTQVYTAVVTTAGVAAPAAADFPLLTTDANANTLAFVTTVPVSTKGTGTFFAGADSAANDTLSVYIVGAGAASSESRTSQMTKKINVYSFALKPEEHQPSGTCNFSRIDNAKLDTNVALTAADNIYAVNYNVLRIMSGMGGLAYSN
jgi:hypothetical protein